MIQKLLDEPATLLAIVAILVSIFSFLATADSAKSARRSAEVSEKLAADSRPRVDIDISDLAAIESSDTVFRGAITFTMKNKGARLASNLSHRVFYIYKPSGLGRFDVDKYIEIAEKMSPQFENDRLFPNDDQTITQRFVGETIEALVPVANGMKFSLAMVVAVQYSDELTNTSHWTFEVLPVAIDDPSGNLTEAFVDGEEFVLTNLSVHKSSWSSFSN